MNSELAGIADDSDRFKVERIEVAGNGRSALVGAAGHAPFEVAAIWLRDACRCDACRRPTTNERRLDPTAILPEIQANHVEVVGSDVVLDMSDGHQAVVSVEQLALVAGPRIAIERASTVRRPAVAERIGCCDAVDLDHGLHAMLETLDRDGALIVRGVEPSTAGLFSIAERIGPIHATNYGVTWEIAAVLDPVSEVESDRALLVHTDLPYRTDPPGVQLLLACEIETRGGASTLVDGFGCAAQLQKESPEAFDLLASVPVEYPYVRDHVEIMGRAPLIEASGGRLQRIRRAPDLMGSPILGAGDADAFYRALRRWWQMLDDPRATHELPLGPGDLLMFDNHRMLHGRTAFELGTGGRRRLVGCYLHSDDVASRRAVLRR